MDFEELTSLDGILDSLQSADLIGHADHLGLLVDQLLARAGMSAI